MGNCMITRKRSLAQDKKGDEPPKEIAEEASGRTRSKTSSSKEFDVGDEKKNVRFKLCDKDSINDVESNGMNKKGRGRVVRIRVVVTQSELSQILKESSSTSKYSSSSAAVEQLLSTAIMLRNRKLSQSRSGGGGRGGSRNGRWKPALESIQEDR